MKEQIELMRQEQQRREEEEAARIRAEEEAEREREEKVGGDRWEGSRRAGSHWSAGALSPSPASS